jgi:multiple sugar transport system substrate-binding protein
MIEIKFSYIYNFEQDDRVLAKLLDEFGAQHGIKVHTQRMTWGSAWADLFTIASNGAGADVSHIGSTWVSSLAKMNALRFFKPSEIAEIGAQMPFMEPARQSTQLFEDERVWSIPWTGWIYVVCYRKDLLKKAGLDASKAFGTIQAFSKTLASLKNSSVEIPWLNQYGPEAYTDLLHIAASWIWAAGGDFIDRSGTKVIFDSPQAIQGLTGWLEAFRAVPVTCRKLSQLEACNLFLEGHAAGLLCDINMANTIIAREKSTLIQENFGVTNLTHVPWAGGGSLVIWDHTRWHSGLESASLELTKFLASKETNLRWMREAGQMPARMDALEESYPVGHPLRDAVMQAAHQGRAYINVPLWRRIEYQLGQELSAVLQEANDNPAVESGKILRAHMEPLARRLNITLGN